MCDGSAGTTAVEDGGNEAGFEGLLLEAWELCTDNETVRASNDYKCSREWLSKLTASGKRGASELKQLRHVVCTLRTVAAKCGGAKPGPPSGCAANDPCAREDLVKRKPPPPLNEKLCCALAAAQCECPMDMRRFFRDVAAFTCDGGTLLMRVTGDVLSDFRSFVDTVFGNRVSQIGMVLAREQMTLRDRYAELECRTMNRAQLALMHVRDVMPTFDWNKYATESGYIRSLVVSRCLEDANDVDPDGENARAKGLLYQLNWLRSEIDRADCENHGLHTQLITLTAELAAINGKILANQCRAEAEKKRLTSELDKLRCKSFDQVKTVDKLMETIQIANQNSKASTAATPAAANQP